MQTVKTSDGVELFYKDWGPKDAQPIVFHHAFGLYRLTIGTLRCCFLFPKAIVSWLMTDAVTVAPRRWAPVTT